MAYFHIHSYSRDASRLLTPSSPDENRKAVFGRVERRVMCFSRFHYF